MYNTKNVNSHSGLLVGGGILTFFGIIISIIFFSVFYIIPILYDTKAPVDDYHWRKVDVDSYSPTIEFEYDDEEYECRPNMTSSDKFEIDNVYFKKDNPHDCAIDLKEELGNVAYYIMIIPGILLGFGLILIIKGIGKSKKNKRLKFDGILVKNIDCTVQNLNAYANGKRYYRITANYTFPDGTTKTLTQMVLGDRKVDKVNHNKCDLLYLLEDYSVYCLDFNIEYQSYTF